jgi:hypothetical protein
MDRNFSLGEFEASYSGPQHTSYERLRHGYAL